MKRRLPVPAQLRWKERCVFGQLDYGLIGVGVMVVMVVVAYLITPR